MSYVRKRFVSEKALHRHRTYDDDADEEPNSKFEKPLPASHLTAILGLILVIFSLVIIIEKQLPKGLTIAEENQHPGSFIAERAFNILKNLTRIGPRVAGSHENEVLAVRAITQEIEDIVSGAHPNHVVELDVQRASGAFNLDFLDGMTNVYRDVQNVAVKVGSKIASPHSLLINCHFDTVMDSPGASDDGAGCAVMLEILGALVRSETILRHNVVLLFNGAEENFMPGSHGFVTRHRWAGEVRAFINLEACGAGGREVLFQAGPHHPWILETYAEEVPYPYASSLAQEIFESGAVPGDTDFRIFRDFGNVSGLDFAWSANGYVYHTRFDSIRQVPLGSLQRTGDNILALARGMARGHQLANPDRYRAGNLVFFDFLGAFIVRWTTTVADLINFLSVIVSLYCVRLNAKDARRYDGVSPKTYLTKLASCMGIVMFGWLLCLLFNLGTAAYLTGLGRTMSWYARPYWIFFLYVIPTLVILMVTILQHAKRFNKDLEPAPWTVFQLYYDAYQSVWTVFLLVGMGLRLRSSFIALMWVAFASLGNLLKSKLFGRWRGAKWIFLHVFTVGLPFVQHFYLTVGALYLFIPIMGRAGSGSHAEFLIAVMISLMFGSLFCFVAPLILLIRTVDRIFSILVATFLISFGILLLTPLGFPYSVDNGILAPQRFMIAHSQRVFHDRSGAVTNASSGYWIVDMDVNSPRTVDKYVPLMKTARPIRRDERDCVDHLYCGLPYLVPVLTMLSDTHWVAGPEPKLPRPVNMTVVDRRRVDGGERVEFEIHGPAHIGAIISPFGGIEVNNWSIPTPGPVAGPRWNGRETYFVFYARGLDPVPLRFWIDFKVPHGHDGPITDLAVTSHYLFGEGKASRDLRDFIDRFPDWSTVQYWTASYESWIL